MAYTPEDLYNLYRGQGAGIAAEAADPYSGKEQPGQGQDYTGLSELYKQTTGMDPVDGAGYAAEGSVDQRVFRGDPTSNVAAGGLEAPTREGAGLPEQTPGEAAMMSMKAGGGWGAGASAGGKGFNQGQYQQISKQNAEREGAMANAQAGVRAAYAPVAQAFQTSAESQKAAADAKTNAEMAKLSDEQAQALYMKNLTDSLRHEEQVATAGETARLNKTIADYQASLADYASSKVNPNDMWDGMSGGMRFGTMVTAFVHDFLGAKGIKTSAMDTFKQAIDRNINAQMANIQKKGEVTKGFKALYDLQSQQSKSAEETRTRIRGFYLESAKQHIVANMSQYKSLLATAEGRKALAEVDKEMAKNYMDFTKQVTADSTARMAQDQQWIMHKGNLAVQQAQVAISARANKLAEEKWKDELAQRAEKTKAAGVANALVDPADNIAKRVIVRGSDKEQQNVREAMINTHETNNSIKEIRDLVMNDKATVVDELGVRRWTGEGRKLAEALIDRLAHSQVKANGERATNEDVQQYKKLFPLDQIAGSGIKHMYDYAQKTTLAHADSYIKQYTQDLPKDKWITGGDQAYFKEDTVKANAEYGEFKRGGKQEQAVDIAAKLMGAPDGSVDKDLLKQAGITDKTDIDLDFQATTKAKSLRNPIRGSGLPSGNNMNDLILEDRKAPGWAAGIYVLGQAIQKGGRAGEDAKAALNKIAQNPWESSAIQNDPQLKGMDRNEYNLARQYAWIKLKGQEARLQSTYRGGTNPAENVGDSVPDFSQPDGNPMDVR